MASVKPTENQEAIARDANILYLRLQQDIVEGLRPLPNFPQVATRVSELILDPNYRTKDLVEALEQDQHLTNLLMKVASSSLYPSKEPYDNLGLAIRMMGDDTTRNLVLIYTLDKLFRTNMPTIRQKIKRVWEESARVAAISAWIANFTTNFKSEAALLAGLLQDTGALFIISALGEKMKTDYHWKLIDEIIKQHGNELSVIILERWNMPKEIVTCAQTKDQWLRDENKKPDLADLILIARYHAYLGTDNINNCPKITDMPAAKKVKFKGGEMTPFQGLKIVSEYKGEIADITRLLII
ncbi:MAG: hypothetical protein COA99_15210 [Moraxellaceae bacterium]|nr:MAG: hypothetical protein COA99_15210 [Moraxellaceae bacterium]